MVKPTFARNEHHLLPTKDGKKALPKLTNIFHAYYLTKAVKQYQSTFKNCQGAATAGCSLKGWGARCQACQQGQQGRHVHWLGLHPTATTRRSRADPGVAELNESISPNKSVVTRQVQGQAKKSVHGSGCTSAASMARYKHGCG